MAECSVCGEKRVAGNNVSHAKNRTKRLFMPNLQKIRVQTDKGAKKQYVCTRCIRSGKIKKAV